MPLTEDPRRYVRYMGMPVKFKMLGTKHYAEPIPVTMATTFSDEAAAQARAEAQWSPGEIEKYVSYHMPGSEVDFNQLRKTKTP
jgi:hypothetical protein